MVRVTELVSTIETTADLAEFVGELHRDLIRNPEEWHNITLGHYLQSLSAWIADMKDSSTFNGASPSPEHPSWRTLAEVLLAGKYYE